MHSSWPGQGLPVPYIFFLSAKSHPLIGQLRVTWPSPVCAAPAAEGWWDGKVGIGGSACGEGVQGWWGGSQEVSAGWSLERLKSGPHTLTGMTGSEWRERSHSLAEVWGFLFLYVCLLACLFVCFVLDWSSWEEMRWLTECRDVYLHVY